MKKQLVIIAGATGEIGKLFSKYFADKGDEVFTLSRNSRLNFNHKNIKHFHVDLENYNGTYDLFSKISYAKYRKITFIHSIGLDKFENINYPKMDVLQTIDPSVYSSNVNTFKIPVSIMFSFIKREQIKPSLQLFMIGSVADKYEMPFLRSFSESKNIVRQYMRNLSENNTWIRSLVINISSTVTESALMIRPYSDTKFWLNPNEVFDFSVQNLSKESGAYREEDIYKENPDFSEEYYYDHPRIFKRWNKFVYNK